MAREIAKAYEPQRIESRWAEYWVNEKLFQADPAAPGAPYAIVIPPPGKEDLQLRARVAKLRIVVDAGHGPPEARRHDGSRYHRPPRRAAADARSHHPAELAPEGPPQLLEGSVHVALVTDLDSTLHPRSQPTECARDFGRLVFRDRRVC